MNSNPNAVVGGGSGIGGGVLIVWLLGYFGVDISNEVAATIAGLVAGGVLFIGRNGVKGTIGRIWKGAGK
jgi:uncharacterized membrane protein YfcA